MAEGQGLGHDPSLYGELDAAMAIHGLSGIRAKVENHLLQLHRLAEGGEIGRDVPHRKFDALRQGRAEQGGGLVQQRPHRHGPGGCVGPPSERQNAVDQIPSPLGRPTYLLDVSCRDRARRKLLLGQFGVTEDRGDDVVEIVRDAARQRPYRLHATRALQARRQPDPVALEKLPLYGVGHGVASQFHQAGRGRDPAC